ncbi:O-antigen ligase family protein [Enterococcus sp. AZ163]|uniref:O-antigen ligase family protein n=1 Tax=Enterococcus sp. AZ163 TaxID=2774638 RepID=UPI003D2D39DB
MLVVYQLLLKKDIYRIPFKICLFMLTISFLFTILLNRQYNFLPMLYNFGYLLISIFVIFPVDFSQSIEVRKNKLIQFNNVFILMIFIAGLISVIQFFMLLGYRVPTEVAGVTARQGFLEHRLFGVYTSPNVGALFGYCSIVLSFINLLLLEFKKKKIVFLYLINFITQVVFNSLSSSRGTQITFVFFLTALLLLFFNKEFTREMSNSINTKKIILGTICLLLFIGVGTSCFKKILGTIPPRYISVTQNRNDLEGLEETDNSDESNKVPVKVEHSEEGSEISSGRFNIWKGGISVLSQKPLFGFGELDFFSSSKLNFNKRKLTDQNLISLEKSHGNMHNGYLQVLLASGIVGFLIVYVYYALNILSLFKVFLFSGSNRKNISGFNMAFLGVSLILLLSFFVNELVEVHLLFNKRDVISLIFWYYLGILSTTFLQKKVN